jgi:hypothetical protein
MPAERSRHAFRGRITTDRRDFLRSIRWLLQPKSLAPIYPLAGTNQPALHDASGCMAAIVTMIEPHNGRSGGNEFLFFALLFPDHYGAGD